MGEKRRRIITMERKLNLLPGDEIIIGAIDADGNDVTKLIAYNRNAHGGKLLIGYRPVTVVIDEDNKNKSAP